MRFCERSRTDALDEDSSHSLPSVTSTAPIRLSPSPFWRMASRSLRQAKSGVDHVGVPLDASSLQQDVVDLRQAEPTAVGTIA